MKIIVLGTRGIPDIPGGVETHCEELYPRMVKDGLNEITIVCRSCYVVNKELKQYKNISLKTIYAPRHKYFESIIHSFLSILYAFTKRPDIVHIHAVGPNIMTPLARLLGLKVVMTHHGPDYKRLKWNRIAKSFLKVGEWAGVRFSNKIIVISQEIKEQIAQKYNRNDCILIPNGVPKPNGAVNNDIGYLQNLGLARRKYIFTLGRFVPEKGFHYLIRAYAASIISKNYKLVIAGDADHEAPYSLELKKMAKENNVILTGFIKGSKLEELFSNAALFVLPSYYEGLPISLLEAMSYGLPILASNIPANTQVRLPENSYFEVGNEDVLVNKFDNLDLNDGSPRIEYAMGDYDWELIADKTLKVYESI
ncbi:MAG: glycosyltransferase family 4 protein [Mucilaginibacter sp.]